MGWSLDTVQDIIPPSFHTYDRSVIAAALLDTARDIIPLFLFSPPSRRRRPFGNSNRSAHECSVESPIQGHRRPLSIQLFSLPSRIQPTHDTL